MEVNVQNEDEMILVVVGKDDNAKKYVTYEESDCLESMPVPISVKIEPIKDVKGLYCNEDVNDIFPIAVKSAKKNFMEIQPDIEVLEEEYLSQEDLEEEYITDEIDVKKFETKVTQKKRNPRKTQHNYLLDVAEFPQVITSPKKKKRKYVKKTNPKNAPIVSNVEDYLEIEFLEDDIVCPKEPNILHSGSDEDESNINEIEFRDSKQKGKRKKKHVTKKTEPKIPVSDEEYLEIEYLEEPVNNKNAPKIDEDDDYVPDEDEEEEDEIIYDEDEDEDFQPKGMRKKSSKTHNKPSSKKTTRKPRKRKGTQKSPDKPKAVRQIKSFIAEVRNKQPLFEENEQKLLEYLAEFMRKRRPPTPLPNSYMIKENYEYSCSYCDVDSATEASAAKHYQQAHGPRYLVCLACGDNFRSTANLNKHEKRCRAPDASLQLQARRMFLERKSRGRPSRTMTRIPRPAPGERTKFFCPQCPAVFMRSSLLKEHMHKHTGFRPYQCSECPATYVSQHQLNKHNKKHSNYTKKSPEKPKPVRHIRSFIAEVRNKEPLFEENEQKLLEYLAEFMRKRRPPTPLPNSYVRKKDNEYSCSYCDVESATEASAARHYQESHGPRYLVCLACGDDFRCTANLYKHEKRCRAPDASLQLQARGMFLGRKGRGRPFLTNNKFVPRVPRPEPATPGERTKYFCPQCPAVFMRSSLLKEHMHKHTGFRPYQCSECPATYVSQQQLNKHNKKHSKEQFVCDLCGKVFNMKTSLASHMDSHLRKAQCPVQFVCDLCGKVFKWKISLLAHMHTHEPRPRFGCGRCGRRYAQRSAVKVHIMRDHLHLPPPAACPVCPKRYNRMSHVKYHMKRDHGLVLMTKSTIMRNLPYMKVEQLEGAKIVFSNETDKVVVESTEEIPLLYTQ